MWDLSLVDPDNRRPVDFRRRFGLLAAIDGGARPDLDADDEGVVKLLVTSRALRLRRDRPELFTRYAPMAATGPAADHLFAFDRGGALTLATRLPAGLERAGGWQDTTIGLPSGAWVDEFTGRRFAGGDVRLDAVFEDYPVALLVRHS